MRSLASFRGRRDPIPLDPASMAFRAVPAKSECRGCAFDGQWSDVCKQAGIIAVRAGYEDCEKGFIYVATGDGQMNLSEAGTVAATPTSITKTDKGYS